MPRVQGIVQGQHGPGPHQGLFQDEFDIFELIKSSFQRFRRRDEGTRPSLGQLDQGNFHQGIRNVKVSPRQVTRGFFVVIIIMVGDHWVSIGVAIVGLLLHVHVVSLGIRGGFCGRIDGARHRNRVAGLRNQGLGNRGGQTNVTFVLCKFHHGTVRHGQVLVGQFLSIGSELLNQVLFVVVIVITVFFRGWLQVLHGFRLRKGIVGIQNANAKGPRR
mmetsp:Transcript_10006/g.20689  ORF Transcript_10006/g.20689 Transcript_10006/m.20689 type:complete len:217 (+) Transcript_10006:580-1230(+)